MNQKKWIELLERLSGRKYAGPSSIPYLEMCAIAHCARYYDLTHRSDWPKEKQREKEENSVNWKSYRSK